MDARKVILLVEDNKDDEDLTIRALTKSGVANEIVVARDGAQAMALLHDSDETLRARVQVVLLDLNLPMLSGLEVLEQIRQDERTRRLPVVILTSSREDEDVLRGYTLGANAYVRKPVDFTQFTEAVRTLGLFWLVLNELPGKAPPA